MTKRGGVMLKEIQDGAHRRSNPAFARRKGGCSKMRFKYANS